MLRQNPRPSGRTGRLGMGSVDLLYLPAPPSRLGKLAQELQGKKWSSNMQPLRQQIDDDNFPMGLSGLLPHACVSTIKTLSLF